MCGSMDVSSGHVRICSFAHPPTILRDIEASPFNKQFYQAVIYEDSARFDS